MYFAVLGRAYGVFSPACGANGEFRILGSVGRGVLWCWFCGEYDRKSLTRSRAVRVPMRP